jgi:hypothetical protein
MTLNPTTGVISGTPTTAAASNVTVQLVDANNTPATKSFSITIYDALNIPTSSLADGYLTTAYSQTLAVTGGKTPYTWSLTSGTLPAGLSLNGATGAISGTPTTAGTSNITVQVADANNATATKSLTITTYAMPSISTTSLSAGTSGAAYSQNPGGHRRQDGICLEHYQRHSACRPQPQRRKRRHQRHSDSYRYQQLHRSGSRCQR